jgi:flagellar basal-body rod protein FlgF
LGGRHPSHQGSLSVENILLITLSRQTTLQRELDIIANNIANLSTTAYKSDGAVFAEYLQGTSSSDPSLTDEQKLSFVEDRLSWHDWAQGPFQQTGNPFDVAIDGEGMLVVQTANGERYTRNGALQLNGSGQLVTSAGDLVLGTNGPIVFQSKDNDVVINPDGTIKVREGTSLNSDTTRGKLRLVKFENPMLLQKDSSSNFLAPDGVDPQPVTNPHVIQGTIEKSNVHSVVEMTRMIEVSRTYAEVANIIQQQSTLQSNAIQKLAEVPA